MAKKIRISEFQFKKVIGRSINEEVEGNIVTSFGNSIIDAALKKGILYDENCPDIEVDDGPVLKVEFGQYTVLIVGNTDTEPSIDSSYSPGDYNTPPDGGDIYWDPKEFYPSYIYRILNNGENINDEYIEPISEYVVEKMPKINIDNRYEIIINKEDFEDDDFDIDPYDDVNDR